ncbi:MAG: hypothetical protein H7X88_10435 [Gloeobacteraceae cyanobacterium ES-bin-316]|nr:hypothetical protein [Ferruginibacter sp.]
MIEIIALIFLCRHIGKLALQKGEPPAKWKLITVGSWFGAELLGFILAAMLLGTGNMIGLFLIGLMSAVGGYLIVKAQLDKIPDLMEEEIDHIGENN